MTMSIRFSIAAALTTAFLSTSALVPATTVHAEVSADDGGVSITAKPNFTEAPSLNMITRGNMQGERFEAKPFEVIDLLLTDGTTLTMASGAAMSVDKYAFDPVARTGELAVTLERGTLRVIGGALNNTAPILVTTPTGAFFLDNATAVIVVEDDGATRAVLDYGKSLTLTTADGDEIEIMRPGFEVRVAADGTVSGPIRRAEGDAVEIARALNPGLVTDAEPVIDVEDGVTGVDEDATAAEEYEQVARIEDDLTEVPPDIPEFVAGDAGGETGGGGVFVAGGVIGIVNLTEKQTTQTNNPLIILGQDFVQDENFDIVNIDENGDETPDPNLLLGRNLDAKKRRSIGLTSGAISSSDEIFTRTVGTSDSESQIELENFIYSFSNEGDFGRPTFLTIGPPPFGVSSQKFPIRLRLTFLGQNDDFGSRATPFISGSVRSGLDAGEGGEVSLTSEAFGNTIFGFDGTETSPQAPTLAKMLQDGFTNLTDPAEILPGQEPSEFTGNPRIGRLSDNFIITEIRPALGTEEGRSLLLEESRNRQEIGFPPEVFIVSSFGLGVRVDDNGILLESNLSTNDYVVLAEGLVAALESEDPFGVAEQFLSTVQLENPLTPEEIETALFQLTRQERFIFAAGDVDAVPDDVRRLDTFYITPGLEGFDEDGNVPEGARVAESIRAFLRNGTDLREDDGTGGIPIGDSGLMIIGTPANSVPGIDTDEQSGLLHADIGIDGAGATQRSTVSVTIGHVQYDVDVDPNDQFSEGEEVVLEGRTIGSSQNEGAGASTSAGGDLFNTAAGGGRAVADTDGDGEPDAIPGRATYFVIENFDPEDENRQGGEEKPVGKPEDGKKFAVLRLATGTSSEPIAFGDGGSYSGVSAGMLEQETDGAEVQIRPVTSTFGLTLSPETNRIVVDGAELQFGGLDDEDGDTKGQSVYIDDNRFAARTDGVNSDVAFVSGQVLRQAAASLSDEEGAATKEFLKVKDYEHLKWGFFFGDVVTDGPDDMRDREHMHLGSWIAGKKADPSRLPSNGKATYSGHAFGNVLNGQSLYAAKGSYTNRWNFGSRAGLVTMDFDGAKLNGLARLKDGTVDFSGSLAGGGRTAGVNGYFVEGTPVETQPAAQLGTFQMRGDGGKYNAVGTFGAERQ